MSHRFQDGRMRDSATRLGHLRTSLGGHRTDTLFFHCLPSEFLAAGSPFYHALTYLCNVCDCSAALVGGVVMPVNSFAVVPPYLALFDLVAAHCGIEEETHRLTAIVELNCAFQFRMSAVVRLRNRAHSKGENIASREM
jgi:hypothetical protein